MERRTQAARRHAGAFTLVEILIVVLLIALLAAIALPQFRAPQEDARHVAFINDLQVFAEAAKLFRIRTGDHLKDADTGLLPEGWGEYVNARRWVRTTPIGGAWDVERDSYGVVSALGVDFSGGGEDRDDAYMLEIDRLCDDGRLDTGQFRKLAEGLYFYVLAP
jgi:prepilin-type N-terminal cleavage/methylation domain-containing protein